MRRSKVLPAVFCGLVFFATMLLPKRGEATHPVPEFEATEVESGELVFHRAREADGEVEGFVVDSKLLVETLKARVLEARGLGEVAAVAAERLSPTRRKKVSSSSSATEGYTFTHRFAVPFDSVTAELRLAPLDDSDEGAIVNHLGWGLALVMVGGLFALYRMAATQVAFAQQRSDFVSAVSHELKTPLTAIRMYGEMLQEGLVEDEAKQLEYARTITSESERLTRLINNVLALSRIEKRQTLALRSAEVGPIVREVVEVLRPHAEREGFTLELELPARLPEVLLEADALRQVLFNLIDNSLKYARDVEDQRVTVEASAIPSGGVQLSVRDRGPGVPPDLLETIFEPFYRAEPELTRKHQGTGIGLALVGGLVSAMRGRVSAHLGDGSKPCPGLVVRIQLMAKGAAA